MAESEAAYAKETAAYAKVIARAWDDAAFKAQLLANPRAALAAMEAPVPAEVRIEVVENADQIIFLDLPPYPGQTELSDEALAKAAAECSCRRPDAEVVVRAWKDPTFKALLLVDANAALAT